MADYRDWCHVCNAEINFGSHEPGCPEPARIHAARQEMEWNREQKKKAEERPFKDIEPEDLFEEIYQTEWDISVVREELNPLENKRDAAYRVLNDRDLTFKYLDWKRAKRDEEAGTVEV